MTDERGSSYEGAAPAGAAIPEKNGERRVALVIGNGRYASQNDVLTNPENDAIALAAALSRIGFSGVRTAGDGDFTVDFSRQGVDALLDLDHRRLGRALGAMTRACAGVAQAVIYYAGHGIEVNGENHIIPIDAKLNHISDVRFETHALSVALSAIEDASGLRLVILDACRNNPFRARLFGARDLGGGLRSIEPPSNILVAYAAKHGSTASDGGVGANSPFATALLNHIETPGLEIVDLFREVKDDVLEATSLAQEPYLYGSLGRRREYFIKAREHPASSVGPGVQPDADDRLWARIDGSERIEDYQFYLEQFPSGRHAVMARFEIRQLENGAEAEALERAKEEARDNEEEAQNREASDWANAEENNTVRGYENFLTLWPEGRFAKNARDRINRLTWEQLDSTALPPMEAYNNYYYSIGPSKDDALPIRSTPIRFRRSRIVPTDPTTWGKVSRNSSCPCGSGKKYKHCHGLRSSEQAPVDATKIIESEIETQLAALLESSAEEFEVRVGDGKNDKTVILAPGESIKDASFAPEMVLVPPGSYLQGDETKPVDGINRREVTIGYPLLVGKYPITFDEWDEYHAVFEREAAQARTFLRPTVPHKLDDQGWGRGRRPVINVAWYEAQDYAKWLSGVTGKAYRLLSEAEWEYACRARTETAYSYGNTITKSQAHFSEEKLGSAKQTVEVGSFPANGFGLHDMHGNVWEWCEDAWQDNFRFAPVDGSARKSRDPSEYRVVRGGSWDTLPVFLRSAYRLRSGQDSRFSFGGGFRLAREV